MDAPHNVKLVADIAYVNDDAVLLTRYRDPAAYDNQQGFFLPNDLLLEREDPADAARRILRDQLGVETGAVELVFAESFTGRDRTWHLALHYVASAEDVEALDVASHLAGPEWFTLDALPERGEVAHGGWALGTLERIRLERAGNI